MGYAYRYGRRSIFEQIKWTAEDKEQMAVTKFIDENYPDIIWTASAGGMRTSYRVGYKMKVMGYKKGCPDIMIFEPVGIFHGLFIELKTEKGTAQPDQKIWIEKLNKKTYKAMVCYGYIEAIEIIKNYLSNK